MLLSEREIEVLIKIADLTLAPDSDPTLKYKVFRAQNHSYLDELDDLERDNLLYKEYGEELYWLPLLTLWEIRDKRPLVELLLNRCNIIIESLRDLYIKQNEEMIYLDDLIELTGLKTYELRSGLFFLKSSQIFGGDFKNIMNGTNPYLSVQESILRYSDIASLIERDSKRNKRAVTEIQKVVGANLKGDRIFLCYAHKDKSEAIILYDRLESEGYYPWMDKRDLLPGLNWRKETQKALRTSRLVIILFSQFSVSHKGFVQREFKLALDTLQEIPADELFVIPVRLDDCEVPEAFSDLHYCDLFEPEGYKKLLSALFQYLDETNVESSKNEFVAKKLNPILSTTLASDKERGILAKDLLISALRIRDEIKICQSSFMSGNEYSDRVPQKNETSSEKQIRDSWYAYRNRYKKVLIEKEKFYKLALEAEAFFGADSKTRTDKLLDVVRNLGNAIQTYHEFRIMDVGTPETLKQMSNILYGINKAQFNSEKHPWLFSDDGFYEGLELALENIDIFFRPIIV